MKTLRNTFTMLLCAMISTTFAATPPKDLVLVSEGADNGYEDYKIFIDKSSIKKIKSNTVLFNLVTSGLSLDETITYAEPKVSEQVNDLENQDHFQVVILSEMKCNSKELKPLKYTQYDQNTGQVKEQTPSKENSDDTFESDDLILNNIHKIVC